MRIELVVSIAALCAFTVEAATLAQTNTVVTTTSAEADYAQAQQACRDPALAKQRVTCLKKAAVAHKKAVAARVAVPAPAVTTTTVTTEKK
jgi:hypothetical protein